MQYTQGEIDHSFGTVNPPDDIRNAVLAVAGSAACKISLGYTANIIAVYMNRGNGKNKFWNAEEQAIANRIYSRAYNSLCEHKRESLKLDLINGQWFVRVRMQWGSEHDFAVILDTLDDKTQNCFSSISGI